MSTPFSNSRDAKISDLIGYAKQTSDLKSHPIKVRYTESTTVQSGNYMRITFPRKSNDAMLDCRSIKMRCNLNIASTDPGCILAGSDFRCIVNRLRVLSGSTVLLDLAEASQAFVIESFMQVSNMDSVYSRYLKGQQDAATRATYPNGREYIVNVTPEGTILNSESLLPLSRMSDLHLEYWLERPERALYSPANDTNATFSISNIEFLCEYITSPSISQYFNSNGLRYSVVDLSHRYNAILAQEYLLRLSSSHVSLNGVTNVIREQQRVADISVSDKFELFDSGANRERYNILVNNTQWFEEDENSIEQSWQHVTDLFPRAEFASFFDGQYETTRNVLCTNLMAAPPEFQTLITSGIRTSAMNSDLTYRIRRTAAPATPLRADSYLSSDATLYMDGLGKDLKIKF